MEPKVKSRRGHYEDLKHKLYIYRQQSNIVYMGEYTSMQNVAPVIVNGMVWQYIAQCNAHLPCEVVWRGLSATVRTLPATEPASISSLHLIFWVDHFYIIWRDCFFPSNYLVTLRGTDNIIGCYPAFDVVYLYPCIFAESFFLFQGLTGFWIGMFSLQDSSLSQKNMNIQHC